MNKPSSSFQYWLAKEISYIKLFEIIVSRWYWIASALMASLFAAYFYLCVIQPQYITTASLKFEDKRSEISELINIRNVYERTNKVESEKQIICSKNVISKAVASL